MASKKRTTWEASGGIMCIAAGKKRNGKPRMVLAIQVITVMTKADAVAVQKAHPSLKFVERTGSTVRHEKAAIEAAEALDANTGELERETRRRIVRGNVFSGMQNEVEVEFVEDIEEDEASPSGSDGGR